MNSLISKQVVLDILNRERYKWGNDCRDWEDAINEIEGMPGAEKAEDLISRKAVLDYLKANCDEFLDYHEAIEVVIAMPRAENTGWIPISEMLPEDEQEILFSTKTGRVHSGKYHDDDSANQWYSHGDKCRAWNNVVNAWMPIPEPFRAESEVKG